VRRDADDLLAGRDQRLLKAARHAAAVLDRPHPLVIKLAGPAQRCEMPRLLGLDLTRCADPARALIDGCQRVCALVRVRPDHDHLHHPLRWSFDEADLQRTAVSWGDATLLSSHAEGPRAAAGDRSFCGSDQRRHETLESARRQPENQPHPPDDNRLDPSDDDTDETLAGGMAAVAGSHSLERAGSVEEQHSARRPARDLDDP